MTADSDGGFNYTGDGTSGVYIFGATREEGSVATSYIPTNGSTVTRVQDVVNNAGDVNTFNSVEGVLFVEMAALSNDLSNRFITLSNGASSNRIGILYSTVSNRIKITVYDGTNLFQGISDAYTITDNNKIALKYKANDMAFWINGVEISTSSINWNPLPFDRLDLSQYNGTLKYFGKIKQLQVFKTALSDAELISLTS
jgi:hypothetical protein